MMLYPARLTIFVLIAVYLKTETSYGFLCPIIIVHHLKFNGLKQNYTHNIK